VAHGRPQGSFFNNLLVRDAVSGGEQQSSGGRSSGPYFASFTGFASFARIDFSSSRRSAVVSG
jgi:predicted ATP-grasp superfamily ATP-dependent carboligase